MSRYSLTHYPAGAATSGNIKREVYRFPKRIYNASGHLRVGSNLYKQIEPIELLYIYTYESKKICPMVSAAIGEKRLRRDKGMMLSDLW